MYFSNHLLECFISLQAYEAVRAKAAAASLDPLRCAWVCASTGLQCRVVGPFSRCMCDHSFREHDVLQSRSSLRHDRHHQHQQEGEETEIQVRCKVPQCRCPQYTFVPVQGSADFRCRCKHSYRDHDPASRHCRKCSSSRSTSSAAKPSGRATRDREEGPSAAGKRGTGGALKGPQGCTAFDPPTRCACGSAYGLHETRFWFDSEKDAPGAPGSAGTRRAGAPGSIIPMGGLTGRMLSR